MSDLAIYVGLAVIVVVGLAGIARANFNFRAPAKPHRTVEELRIEVKADTQAATEAVEKLREQVEAVRESAQQVDDLLAGRSVQAIEKLTLDGGDTLVVMCVRLLTPEQRKAIAENVKSRVSDGVKVMVLDGGLKLATIRTAEINEDRAALLCEG